MQILKHNPPLRGPTKGLIRFRLPETKKARDQSLGHFSTSRVGNASTLTTSGFQNGGILPAPPRIYFSISSSRQPLRSTLAPSWRAFRKRYPQRTARAPRCRHRRCQIQVHGTLALSQRCDIEIVTAFCNAGPGSRGGSDAA